MPALQRQAWAEERLLGDLRQSVPHNGRDHLHLIDPNPPEFAQPRLSTVKGRSSPARGTNLGVFVPTWPVPSHTNVMTGHILGEGKWGRKKCKRIRKCEGYWQGRVPKRSLHPKTLQNKRFGAPNVLGISPKLFAALRGIHPYLVSKYRNKHTQICTLSLGMAAL